MVRRRKSGSFITALIVLILIVTALFILNRYPSGQVIGNAIGGYKTTTTQTSATTVTTIAAGKQLRICSWNLQRFGAEKAGNESLMDRYVSKLSGCDIAVVQEVVDSNGEAFNKLCGMMKGYNCIESKRLGPSTYKEQYGVFYKGVNLNQVTEWSDTMPSGEFTRAPYSLDYTAGNWSFRVTTIHTDPDKVKSELSNLEKITKQDNYSGDEIIIGDLNADCSYYHSPHTEFSSWTWAIPDGEDTTVKSTDCAYDRIIVNPEAANNYLSYGVEKDITPDESDHYMVWGMFQTDRS